MPLTFGTKKKDAPEPEGDYLRNFKKGETKVRFLEEPDEWMLYQEHFTSDRRSFPCTTDVQSCPGCTSDDENMQRRSRKYGTFIYLTEVNQVLPFKVAISLANRMTARAERNGGTITNRDYVVIRSGEGLKTDYDVDQDERYSLDIPALLAKAPAGSVEQVLQDMFRQVWGDPDQFAGTDGTQVKKSSVTGSRNKQSPVADTPSSEDVPDTLKTKEERDMSGVDEFKPKTEEKDEEVTEAQVRSMSRSQLVEIWNKAGFDGFDEDWGKTELAEEILKRAE